MQTILRMCILPMPFGVFTVLDCKFRTVMQAGQTHDTLRLNPFGLVVFYLNGSGRTVFCAQSAADAVFFN